VGGESEKSEKKLFERWLALECIYPAEREDRGGEGRRGEERGGESIGASHPPSDGDKSEPW
jgi:hypothetical protein